VSAGNRLPEEGRLIVTVNERDRQTVTPMIRRFRDMGFEILATRGTLESLKALGVPARLVYKVGEGRPDIVDHIVTGDIQLLINTPLGKKSQYDDYAMRRAAITHSVPYLTTMSATSAACDALIALRSRRHEVRSIQERIASLRTEVAAD
jgi:carbamoyl-phosphate synthase large subunit